MVNEEGIDGMLIRQIKVSDAEAFLSLCCRLEEETTFMALEAGERKMSLKEQQGHITNILNDSTATIFVAEINQELVGYCGIQVGNHIRDKHTAYIAMGVLQKHIRQGIGQALLQRVLQWALDQRLGRLELVVLCHNEAAISLYQKMGFVVEGRKKYSVYCNGSFWDEYVMAKYMRTIISSK